MVPAMQSVSYPIVVGACLTAYLAIVVVGKYFEPSQDLQPIQAAVANSIAPASGQPQPQPVADPDNPELSAALIQDNLIVQQPPQTGHGPYGYAAHTMDENVAQ